VAIDRSRCHHVVLMTQSDPLQPAPGAINLEAVEEGDLLEAEILDGELLCDAAPALAGSRSLAPAPAALPAVTAAAAVATGFVAGAATLALVRRHSARKLSRTSARRQRRGAEGLPIVGSRSFLIDVHLIAKPGE
jgi:uncharacterized membrane protein